MRPKLVRRRSRKSGLPPGTLIHIGERKVDEAKITVFFYDEARFEEAHVRAAEEIPFPKDESLVTWINVDGIHQTDILERLGERFGLHPLVLEDILNTEQRPKMEDYGDYVFLVVKMLSFDSDGGGITAEQVSLILGPNYVLSFQEKEGDVFNPLRERLRSGKGRVRKLGADHLMYSQLDAIVDSYFFVLEQIGEKVEFLEDELVTEPTQGTMQAIHDLKRHMIFLRRSVWPLREVVGGLERGESPLIQEPTSLFLRDVYDHTIQVIDTVEAFRDMLSGMLDLYLSSVSNRMNEVMKVLTIIATLFIPITALAGIYGMNFRFMPELELRWTYPLIWFIMLLSVGVMLIYFRRKKWL
jgi:magnesium transporter